MAGFTVVKRGLDPERPAGSAAATGAVTSPQIASVNGGPPLSTGPLALQVISEDITAAVQADLNANKPVILLPVGLSTISATLTPPSTLPWVHFIGWGNVNSSRGTYLKLANGVNADMFSFPITCSMRMSSLRLDGNSANNSSGNIVNFPASTGYQNTGTFVDVGMLNAAENCLLVGFARSNGLLVNCNLGAAGVNCFNCSGGDWRWQGGTAGPATTAGNANMYLPGANNFKASGIDIFNSLGPGVLVGFNAFQTFWDQCKINNNAQQGMVFDQWASGLAFQNLPNDHEITGCSFSENSAASTGTYSDILLHGVIGARITANFRFEDVAAATFPKYHVEDQVVNNPAGGSSQRIWLAAQFLSTPLGANPTVKSYVTGVTNVADLVRVDHDQVLASQAIIAGLNKATL